MSRLIVALYIVLFSCVAHGADIEEGKVLKYYSFDPKTGVIPEGLPALTIEDLRKITLYSELNLKGGKLEVADKKHMRRIDPLVTDPTVLAVTSDHFRFTVLKNGVIDPKQLSEPRRKYFKFLWVKHVTHESPDGAPWLKDMILIPCDMKEKKLLQPWPVFQKRRQEDVFFLDEGDPRPEMAGVPPLEASIVGTFESGKVTYLVFDVFGNYSWWGKVTQLELIMLRGASQQVRDEFHKDTKLKSSPPWHQNEWTDPESKDNYTLTTRDVAAHKALVKALPACMALPVNGEAKTGWEDLLRLEEKNEPAKSIDAKILALKTFGQVLHWARDYLSTPSGGGHAWDGILDDVYTKGESSDIVKARVVRYAFRRMGYPTQLLSPSDMNATLRPFIHVCVPSQRISVVLRPRYDGATVFPADSVLPYSLPDETETKQGKIPVFEITRGAEMDFGAPTPSR